MLTSRDVEFVKAKAKREGRWEALEEQLALLEKLLENESGVQARARIRSFIARRKEEFYMEKKRYGA